jgi:hypothetical protein
MTNEQIMRVAIQSGAEIDERYLYSVTFTQKGLYDFAKSLTAAEHRLLEDRVEKDLYVALAR